MTLKVNIYLNNSWDRSIHIFTYLRRSIMYLVIGANGFLGSYMLKNILEKTNDFVIAVARYIEREPSL